MPGGLLLIEPMLAVSVKVLPAAERDWAAEAKWDGRALAYVSGGEVVIRSRGGRDVTGTFPELAAGVLEAADGRAVILDGEVAALDGSLPSFALLQRRLHVSRPAWSCSDCAAAAASSTSAAFCCVTSSIWVMARLISSMPVLCS